MRPVRPVSRASDAGFTLIEVLIGSAVMVFALSIAVGAFRDLARMNDGAELVSDLNVSLRNTVNLISRDLISAGRDIPTGGVSIPSGMNADPLVRPSPAGTFLTFPGGQVSLPALSPADGLGPAINGRPTDMINILVLDPKLPELPVTVAPDGSSAVVDAGVNIDGAEGIGIGDVILFKDSASSVMQMVTGRAGRTVTFADGDPMRLNQRQAAQGTILQLNLAAANWRSTAYRVLMISYYLDAANAARPMLMRRVNLRAERPIAIGIENLQFSYDLVDGVTNPANVPTPVLPLTPNQIRKANVYVAGRSYRKWNDRQQYLRSSLTTQVSLRSLSFVDRYQAE